MRDLWFISDTHFDHDNILKFTRDDGSLVRPGFENVTHMNETMIENWNKVVKPGDHVYHLGDFCMGSKTIVGRIIPRLNGRKRLVVGNHDQIKELCPFFEKVSMWRIFKEFNFFCMHVPQSKDIFRKTAYQVHGHIHANLMTIGGHSRDKKSGLLLPWRPDPAYINVCVEHTNYTPIHLDQILEHIKNEPVE